MAKAYRPVDRDQQFLLPPSLDEWLPPGHVARLIVEVVAAVDTTAFHRRGVPKAWSGRASYDPDMMLCLLVHAYAHGVRSSRQIERLCEVDVAFRWICAQDGPDHTTLSRFVAAHEEAFKALFAQVLMLCGRAGLGRVGSVAVDGTKIAANASLGANRGERWLREQVEAMVAQARETDEAEDALFGAQARGDEMPEDMLDPRSRAARIRRCYGQVQAERAAAETDRAGEVERTAFRAGEAAERAVRRLAAARAAQAERVARYERAAAAKRAAAAAAGRPAKGPDGRAPVPVEEHVNVRGARESLARAQERAARLTTAPEPVPVGQGAQGKEPVRNVTDPDSRVMPTRRGWSQGFNAQIAVTDDHLILTTQVTQDTVDSRWCTPMMTAAGEAAALLHARSPGPPGESPSEVGLFLFDAGYLSVDNLTAEGPDRLIAVGKTRAQIRAARDNPAVGAPPQDAPPMEKMSHRLRTPEGDKAYRRRGATVEPVIGHLKDITGLRQFRRRGLRAAEGELDLAATAVNLLKLHRLGWSPAA